MKRSLAATLAGAALAVGAAAVAAVPAHAANVVDPGNNPKVSYTPGVSTTVDMRWVYNGAAGDFTAGTFTVNLPAGVSWDPSFTPWTGKGAFLRVVEAYGTNGGAYLTCDITSPTKLTCGGGIYDGLGNVSSVPIQPGETFLIRGKVIVDPAATGALDTPITGSAYINVNGWQPNVNAQLTTIDLPQQAGTPVIAPAVAGIALLGASGIGGAVALKRRKKTATPAA